MKKKFVYGIILTMCLLSLLFHANAQDKNVQLKQRLEIGRQSFPADRKDVRELIKNKKIDPRLKRILELRKNKIAQLRNKAGQSFTGNSIAGNQRVCNANDIELTNTSGEIANDPHIALDPANPNNLIISSVYTHNAY